MKIRVTLNVGPEFRKYLAAHHPCKFPITAAKEAHRKDVIAWVMKNFAELEGAAAELNSELARARGETAQRRQEAMNDADARDAIDYLRKAGKTDDEICAWLFIQRGPGRLPTRKSTQLTPNRLDIKLSHRVACAAGSISG